MKSAICGLLVATTLACADAETSSQATAGSQAQTPVSGSPSPNQDTVVAEVAGRKITLKDVDDRWQQTDPGERARVTQLLYQNQKNVLDQMVADALIEEAAKAAGMPVEQFVEQESAKVLEPVTDADIKEFYDINKDRTQGRTMEQLAGAIRDFLRGNRRAQARAQLVDNLKQKSRSLKVMLQPPRQHVELASHDPTLGPATAPVTIIEFSDYQ
jgi:SurA-like N-terminal domain